MERFPWLKLLSKKSRKDLPLRTPIWLDDHSNGEYYHPQNARERRAQEIILKESEHHARRYGVDRRQFLASSAGMALSLGVLNSVSGCGDDGGGYQAPNLDDCVERGGDALGGNEFIFDIQTHHFDPDASWRETNALYDNFISAIGSCGAEDPVECFSKERYAEKLFLESDTTMAVLSSWPATTCSEAAGITSDCGLPLPNTSIVATRDWFNSLAMSERLINHCQIMPNLILEEQLDVMEEMATRFGVAAWKLYPAWGPDGVGFWMDDDIAIQTIEKGRALGVKVFCIHKGLPIPGFDLEHNFPWDIGRVAKEFPDCKFIVYHSAICAGAEGIGCDPTEGETLEGPYNEGAADGELRGVDTLVRSLENAGVGPNENVYGELGSCWSNVMNDPAVAQHVIGKLLKHVGEDNVVWGTDYLVSRAAQEQIDAFRSFSISEENQTTHGYPELTTELKAKVFGLNAAAVYGVDPNRERCRVDANQIQTARLDFDAEFGGRRFAIRGPGGPRTRREFLNLARIHKAQGIP
ncbi:MAG: amidohydrolase family protein, partial [Myxococcota bacterium]